jgi:phosphomevalonate kinase
MFTVKLLNWWVCFEVKQAVLLLLSHDVRRRMIDMLPIDIEINIMRAGMLATDQVLRRAAQRTAEESQVHEYVKRYNCKDVEALMAEVDDLARQVFALQDTMINSRPWAAHWLGGDIEHGATEVQPPRFAEARSNVSQAARLLRSASHELAMYFIESADQTNKQH